MTSIPQYEIHAIKYAEAERQTRDCFLMPDPHDGPMPMDYFVWLIRGDGRTVLLDTGFTEPRAKARKPQFLRWPSQGWAVARERVRAGRPRGSIPDLDTNRAAPPATSR